jgi:hypothetical protein
MPLRNATETRIAPGSRDNNFGLILRMHHNDHEWQRKRVREWTAEASYSSSTKGHTSEIGSEDGQPRLSPAPAVVSAASDGHHNDDEQEPPANRRRIAAFDWDDWDDLKQLYTDAVERVESAYIPFHSTFCRRANSDADAYA